MPKRSKKSRRPWGSKSMPHSPAPSRGKENDLPDESKGFVEKGIDQEMPPTDVESNHQDSKSSSSLCPLTVKAEPTEELDEVGITPWETTDTSMIKDEPTEELEEFTITPWETTDTSMVKEEPTEELEEFGISPWLTTDDQQDEVDNTSDSNGIGVVPLENVIGENAANAATSSGGSPKGSTDSKSKIESKPQKAKKNLHFNNDDDPSCSKSDPPKKKKKKKPKAE